MVTDSLLAVAVRLVALPPTKNIIIIIIIWRLEGADVVDAVDEMLNILVVVALLLLLPVYPATFWPMAGALIPSILLMLTAKLTPITHQLPGAVLQALMLLLALTLFL